MVLLSYIVNEDYGFAPNPYWGMLTLTTCKSPIRRGVPRARFLTGRILLNYY